MDSKPLPSIRCDAATGSDTHCVGGRAVVRVVTRDGTEVCGCIPHIAAFYATSPGARLYPAPGHTHTLSEVYARAQMHTRPSHAHLRDAA